MSADFPAPFSPISACTSPRRTSKPTSSTARTPGNVLVTLRIANRGVSGNGPWLFWLASWKAEGLAASTIAATSGETPCVPLFPRDHRHCVCTPRTHSATPASEDVSRLLKKDAVPHGKMSIGCGGLTYLDLPLQPFTAPIDMPRTR